MKKENKNKEETPKPLHLADFLPVDVPVEKEIHNGK